MLVRGRLTFSLSFLMLVVACVAVASSLGAAAPGLGVLFGILALAALIRTAMLLRREFGPLQTTPGVGLKAFTFFESMVVLSCVLIACAGCGMMGALVGFFLGGALCAALMSSELLQLEVGACTGVGLGVVTGLSALVPCLRAYWSRRQF